MGSYQSMEQQPSIISRLDKQGVAPISVSRSGVILLFAASTELWQLQLTKQLYYQAYATSTYLTRSTNVLSVVATGCKCNLRSIWQGATIFSRNSCCTPEPNAFQHCCCPDSRRDYPRAVHYLITAAFRSTWYVVVLPYCCALHQGTRY